MFRIASEEKKLGRGLHTGWGGGNYLWDFMMLLLVLKNIYDL